MKTIALKIGLFLKDNLELLFWVTAIVLLYFLNDHTNAPSLCFFKFIGISWCPGCGIGRSIHFALHLKFSESFKYHPLGIFALIIIFIRVKQLTFKKSLLMSLNLLTYIPSIEADELAYIQSITKDLPADKMQAFITVYNSKRQKSDVILLTTLLGFVGFAGIQRFITGQIGMGLVYFFTAGLCFVGTIIDAINYKKMAFEFNQGMALESMRLIQGY